MFKINITFIAISRAIYKKNDIIIFDEATSSLNKQTSKKIISNLINFLHNSTFIFVTHDEDLISFSDRSFNVTNQTIIEIK